MCGIVGMLDLHQRGRVSPSLTRAMCDCIRHRGPDGEGHFHHPNVGLGMRRLSIIDVNGSEQPLYNHDGTLALVFNGEIYNYRELRTHLIEQGYDFRTDGDGETILHLYEAYGVKLFEHLRGMYAFALWDARQERLLVAVDHIGMKPLYLLEQDGLLAFASEVKAFFTDEQRMLARLNLNALDTYLSFGFQVGQATLFEGVQRLPAGHYLVAEKGAYHLHPYWQFGTPPLNPPQDAQDWVEQTRHALVESVRLHLRSDVPLGLFLSGGIDSASILGIMAQEQTESIQTFTVGYQASVPDNELHHAQRIAAHFHTQHHERIITAQDWWAGFERYIYHEDEPTANPSAVSLMLLAEDTAKHVKVVLTGLGGDELFGGYAHHRSVPRLLTAQARYGKFMRPITHALHGVDRFYPMLKRYRGLGAIPTYLPNVLRVGLSHEDALLRTFSYDGMVFSDGLRQSLYGADLKRIGRAPIQEVYHHIIQASQRDNPHNTALALVANTWLHGNALLHADKVTMAHSLEARIPMFEPHLIQLATAIPPQVRMQANKWTLREAVRPYVPTFALDRPKQPFSTPIRGWFERELKANIEAILLNPDAKTTPLFDKTALARILHQHFNGSEKHEEVVFRLLTLELWAQRFEVSV